MTTEIHEGKAIISPEDSPETNADKLVKPLRDSLMRSAVDAEIHGKAILDAAIAEELNHRLNEPSDDIFEIRSRIDTDAPAENADEILNLLVTELTSTADELADDPDERHMIRKTARELSSRIRGDDR